MKINDETIKAYVLKNALSHKGKANPGSVVSSLFTEGLEKKDIKTIMPKIQTIIKEIGTLDLNSQEKEYNKLKSNVNERSSFYTGNSFFVLSIL